MSGLINKRNGIFDPPTFPCVELEVVSIVRHQVSQYYLMNIFVINSLLRTSNFTQRNKEVLNMFSCVSC